MTAVALCTLCYLRDCEPDPAESIVPCATLTPQETFGGDDVTWLRVLLQVVGAIWAGSVLLVLGAKLFLRPANRGRGIM